MKTYKKSMPKSINSKKNEQHTNAAQTRVNTAKSDFRPLKELNGQVLVSEKQYKEHPELFLGTPCHNLRLKDGREVAVAMEVGNKAIPLERVATLLKFFVLFVATGIISPHDPSSKRKTLLDTARAFKIYCAIMDFLNLCHKQDTLDEIRQFDDGLYSILGDDEKVEHLVSISKSKCESPLNPKIQFLAESIDVEYLSHLIESSNELLLRSLDNEFYSEEEYFDFAFNIIIGCIMVSELRGMERGEAVKYFLDKLNCHASKEDAELFFNMLTIDKEA